MFRIHRRSVRMFVADRGVTKPPFSTRLVGPTIERLEQRTPLATYNEPQNRMK